MVGHHPAVRQVNILMELNRNHFGIHLDDHTFQPVADPFFIFIIMITKNLYHITDTIITIFLRRG